MRQKPQDRRKIQLLLTIVLLAGTISVLLLSPQIAAGVSPDGISSDDACSGSETFLSLESCPTDFSAAVIASLFSQRQSLAGVVTGFFTEVNELTKDINEVSSYSNSSTNEGGDETAEPASDPSSGSSNSTDSQEDADTTSDAGADNSSSSDAGEETVEPGPAPSSDNAPEENSANDTTAEEADPGAEFPPIADVEIANLTNVTNDTVQTVNVTFAIIDSDGLPVPATIELAEEAGEVIQPEILLEGFSITAEASDNEEIFEIEPGKKHTLTVTLSDADNPVKEIEFSELEASDDIALDIGIDDVPENLSLGIEAVEVYAIDPSDLSFATGEVTVTAKGNQLYKCRDWDFANQTCFGTWEFLQNIVPGDDYTIALTPEDPGYAETIGGQACAAEDNAAKGSFAGSCDGVYPSSCGAAGDLLSCDDNLAETHTYQKTLYGGARATQYNTSITDCLAITNVELCYEWWRTGGASPQDCDISIDNQNGTNFTAVTTTCPGIAANPGITCANVTGTKAWTCTNFFGSGNYNRSMIKSEITRVTTGSGTTETATWDALFFKVNYTQSATEVLVSLNITDASGTDINSTVNIYEPNGSLAAEASGGRVSIISPVGNKKLRISPNTTHPIKEINFTDVNLVLNISVSIGLDDVPATEGPASQTLLETYAIDPTQLNFTNATFIATAQSAATSLYKCASWNFTSRTCTDGNWTFVQNITGGANYSVTISGTDPAFTETTQPSTEGKDSYIQGSTPTTNYGTNVLMRIGKAAGGGEQRRRGIIEFNVSSIPSNAKVTYAALNISADSGDSGIVVNIYRVTASWDEGNVTWGNRTATAAWTTAGGDFDTFVWANATAPGASNGSIALNITGLVQNWVNGTYSNFGMIIAASDETSNTGLTFHSSDAIYADRRPKLTVIYYTPPLWSQQTQNNSNPAVGDAVKLSAYWNDTAGLNTAWLETNESGTWQNKTTYGSPFSFSNATLNYSNFTWVNSSVAGGTVVGWRIHTNNSGGAANSTDTMAFMVGSADSIAPNVAIIRPENTTYNTQSNLALNYTATDNIAVDKCWVSHDAGPNTTLASCANSTFSVSGDGSHNTKVFANDTSGKQNSSIVYYTIDSAPPQWSNQNGSTPATFSSTAVSQFNITWTDATSAIDKVLFESNFTGTAANYTMYLISGSTYSFNTTLPAGTHYWKSYANDTVGNMNVSYTLSFTIDKASNPINLTINSDVNQNVTITYGASSTVSGNATAGTVTLARDGVSATNPETATFAANSAGYKYNASTAGNQNYSANESSYYLFVNKQATSVNLTLNGTEANLTTSYNVLTNASATGTNGTVTLYRDSAAVSNPELALLASGTYNYTAVIPDDTNRTGSSKTFFLIVNKASPTLALVLNGTAADLSVLYLNTTNATASEANTGDSDLAYTLYRNGANMSSGSLISDIGVLAAGTYVYVYNTSGGVNYTSATVNRTLTVGKAPTDARLFLNGTEANKSIVYGNAGNVTATLNVSGLTFQLFRDGASVASGTGSINESVVLAAGTYNYTAQFDGNDNYTGDLQTYFLTVNRSTPSLSLLVNGSDSDISTPINTNLTVNASAAAPAGATVELYEGAAFLGSGSTVNVTRNYTSLGTFVVKVNITQTQNYTSGEKNHTISVVDSSVPQFSNLREYPTDPATYSSTAAYRFNVTWTDDLAISDVLFEFNGVNYSYLGGQLNKTGDVYNKTFGVLAAGTYYYRWLANDTSGNWGITANQSYTIDKAITALFLTFTPGSSVSYGAESTVTCTANNLESSPALTRNSSSVSNPDVQSTLTVAAHNYACTAAATQNYTSASATGTLTVSKASPTINLTLNGQHSDISVDTGTAVNITAIIVTPSGQSMDLTENSTLINSGASPLTNLSTYNTAGTFTFNATYGGNENYSAGSKARILTVSAPGGGGSPGGGSGGGGGGGGGSGGGGVATASEICPPVGVPKLLTLSFGGLYSCRFGQEVHTIRFSGVINELVELTVSSDPVKAQFQVGQTKLFDFDSDGISDLEVTVLSKDGNSLNLRITFLTTPAVVVEVPAETIVPEIPAAPIPPVTGAAVQVKPFRGPNPLYAVPTLLLLILVFAILALRNEQISPKTKKVLTVLHVSLIVAVAVLLFFTFVRAPSITGGAVLFLNTSIPKSGLIVAIPMLIAGLSIAVIAWAMHHKNQGSRLQNAKKTRFRDY